MRGYPQFFYGTEVLMTNEKAGNDGERRTDFYGGWNNDSKNAFTSNGLTQDELEAQRYFSKLLNWRKNAPAMADGKITHYAPQNNVYVYFRYDNIQTAMIILNSSESDQTIETARFAENIKEKSYGINAITNEKISVKNSIIVPKYSSVILELN